MTKTTADPEVFSGSGPCRWSTVPFSQPVPRARPRRRGTGRAPRGRRRGPAPGPAGRKTPQRKVESMATGKRRAAFALVASRAVSRCADGDGGPRVRRAPLVHGLAAPLSMASRGLRYTLPREAGPPGGAACRRPGTRAGTGGDCAGTACDGGRPQGRCRARASAAKSPRMLCIRCTPSWRRLGKAGSTTTQRSSRNGAN